MSNIRFTPAQQDAVKARGGNVLVSAAAGSGKTAVLVQRIIDAVTDKDNPVSIDRMMVVTFTRAATAEMRSRIEQALNALLVDDPYNKYLLNQKHLLYNARISTIDSFCTDFVRRYFYKLDIQRDFGIPDRGEEGILLSKALENTLEYFYQKNDKGFLNLVSALCSLRNDDYLKNHILKIYRFLTALPFPEEWMKQALRYYDTKSVRFEDTPYFRYIIKYARDCLFYCLELNKSCFELLDSCESLEEKHIEKIRDTLKDDFTVLNSLNADVSGGKWDKVYDAVHSFSFGKFPPIRGASDDNTKNTIMSIRNACKNEIKALGKVFISDYDTITGETDMLYPLIKALFDCVERFTEEFRAIKSDKNLLTYSDIEHLTVQLLCRNNNGEIEYTDIAREIASEFDLIMVDEFQDINDTQNLIFSALSFGKDNLFAVGDVKQSIYGFRQAKPEIFINYKNSFNLYNRDFEKYPAKIILDKNFRSRRGIIEACNFVFSTLMSRETGGIDYNDEEKLVCGAQYPESTSPNMELLLIDTADIDKEEDETKAEFEAARVAEKIYNLIFEEKLQVRNGSEIRNVTFGDIAVLLRSARGDTRRAATFAKVLREYAIPVVSEEKNNFFEENEIKVMLNLLRVIDNPLQDIPVLSVLMSPVFGFTADEMAVIRSKNRNTSIYNAVKLCANENKKCEYFISFINQMRSLAVTTTVDRLIGAVMKLTGFDSVINAVRAAESRNLYLLQDYARKYAAGGYKTLTSFIGFIDRLRDSDTAVNSSDEPAADNLNAVHIMSIHASKGLEFPVCFISSVSTQFNMSDTISDLTINTAGGVGIRYRDELIKYDTIQRKAISMMMTDSQISEEMRILYVALTRAGERLIITSAQSNPGSYISGLESKISSYPISPYVIKKSRSFSDWLFMCALANPSCGNLRNNLLPDYNNYEEYYRPWRVEIVKEASLPESGENAESSGQTAPAGEVDSDLIGDLISRLNFVYKNKALITLPQKVSASQLSHRENRVFNKLLRKPEFISGEKSSGAQKGSAFHRFMECCDLKKAAENPEAEAENLVTNGFITQNDYELLDFNSLKEFLNSELISRALNSGKYFREYTFTVRINAEDYNPDIEPEFKNHKIIMQGAVDLAFVEDNEIVIVDYKTDRVGDIEKLGRLYKKQVELYKSALEESMSLRVKEIIIYSVHLKKQLKYN